MGPNPARHLGRLAGIMKISKCSLPHDVTPHFKAFLKLFQKMNKKIISVCIDQLLLAIELFYFLSEKAILRVEIHFSDL